MDRQETEQVIVNVAQAWVGGQILGVLLVAALPLVGWALLVLAGGLALFTSSAALAFAAGCAALIFLIGGLGMLNEWFGKREERRRTARVAAGGDYLTARERRLKTAWDLGRARREAPRQNPVAFVLGRALRWARRRPATKGAMR